MAEIGILSIQRKFPSMEITLCFSHAHIDLETAKKIWRIEMQAQHGEYLNISGTKSYDAFSDEA